MKVAGFSIPYCLEMCEQQHVITSEVLMHVKHTDLLGKHSLIEDCRV